MRRGIDSPLLWKLSAVIFISMLITCSSGCKFGKKLNTNSTGVVRVITPSDLIEQPNGTYKLKPYAVKPRTPKPVKLDSVKSRPEAPELKSAEASPVIAKPKPARNIKEFSPTISEPDVKLPPKVIRSDNETGVKESPIKISMNINRPQTKQPTDGGGKNEKPKSAVKIDWFGLTFFYLSVVFFCVGAWAIYDAYKSKKKSS
jgi:hypothetical protein